MASSRPGFPPGGSSRKCVKEFDQKPIISRVSIPGSKKHLRSRLVFIAVTQCPSEQGRRHRGKIAAFRSVGEPA